MSFPHALLQKLRVALRPRARAARPVEHGRAPHLRIVGGTAYGDGEQPSRLHPIRAKSGARRTGGLYRWRWE